MTKATSATPRQERDINEMTDDELCEEYVQLCRAYAALIKEDAALQLKIATHGAQTVRFQQSTEVEEDKLANQLLRRLETESREKYRYRELIRQEESTRQEIMEQISQVRSQKTEVEIQYVQEQESLMLQLHNKLLDVVNRKSDVERDLLQERHRYLDFLATQLEYVKQGLMPGAHDANTDNASIAAVASVDHSVAAQTLQGASGTPKRQSGLKAPDSVGGPAVDGSSPAWMASGTTAEADSVSSTIASLEKRLSRMLRKHMDAMEDASKNEEVCAELREKLESVQQAAFLDRARASKLKEELGEAKVRLAETEQRCSINSTISDDSFHGSTPTCYHLKNISLRDRTKEVLSAPLKRTLSGLHISCDTSEVTDDARSFTSSLLRSPAVGAHPCSEEREETPRMELDTQRSSSAAVTPKGLR